MRETLVQTATPTSADSLILVTTKSRARDEEKNRNTKSGQCNALLAKVFPDSRLSSSIVGFVYSFKEDSLVT